MVVRRIALLVVFASTLAGAGGARSEPRAVIELFTSQGCSACPAADRLLGELAHDASVITMSLPIDYWDYIGWQDTLALPENTKRQWAYAHALGERGVSTPQAIINGGIQVLGSDRSAIERAIEQSRESDNEPALPVLISVVDDQIKVAMTNGKTSRAGEIWLCSMSKAVPVVISRGENRGKTITYHNVVRQWRRLGAWTGAAGMWTVPVEDVESDGVDELVVMVQAGSANTPGSILGAAMTPLRQIIP